MKKTIKFDEYRRKITTELIERINTYLENGPNQTCFPYLKQADNWLISFELHLKSNVPYLIAGPLNYLQLNEEFYNLIEEVACNLQIEIEWNNDFSTGWVNVSSIYEKCRRENEGFEIEFIDE